MSARQTLATAAAVAAAGGARAYSSAADPSHASAANGAARTPYAGAEQPSQPGTQTFFRYKLGGDDMAQHRAVLTAKTAAAAKFRPPPDFSPFVLADCPGMSPAATAAASAAELLGHCWALQLHRKGSMWDAVAKLTPLLHHVTATGPYRVFVFDTETTGMIPMFHRIVEAAVLDVSSGARHVGTL